MPLPIGHTLAGLTLRRLCPVRFATHPALDILVCIFLATAADLDFIPGLLIGEPNRYHNGLTHTLGAALLVAAVCALLGHRLYRKGYAWFAMSFALYYSHVVLDFLGEDTSFPYGVRLFWPLHGDHFNSPIPLFHRVTRSAQSADFFSSILNSHNAMAAVHEGLVLGSLLALVWIFRRQGDSGGSR